MTPEIKQRIAQIQRGEVPEGYKKENNTIIPNEWREYKLGDIGEVLMCKRIYANQTSEEDEIPFYKIGTFGKKADAYIARSLYEEYKENYPYPQKGDVLISAAGTLGRIVVYDGKESYFQDSNIVWLKVNKNIISNEYLFFCYQIIVWPIPEGGTIQRLYNSMIRKAQISIPLLSEQKKIVAIIAAQDKVIELKEKLLAEKQRQKKYLMQQLLTGKKRLPGFCGEWGSERLGKLFSERKETNCETLEMLAITGTQGIIPRKELDLKDNSSEDKSKYLKICVGDIGYNTMRMWQGVSAYSNYEGIVSPAYTILKPNRNINAKYFAYLFKMPEIVFLFYRFSQGLVDDTRNLKYENFKKIKVLYPKDKKEQTAIVEVLSTADHEIDLLQKDIEQEKQKKKALMQLLLTGIVRVRV